MFAWEEGSWDYERRWDFVVGRIVSPPHKVLTSGTYECDFIWKEGLCRYSQAKMRSYGIRVGSNPMTDVLIRREKFGHTDTQGKSYATMEAEIGIKYLQAKERQGLLAITSSEGSMEHILLDFGLLVSRTLRDKFLFL